MFKPKQLVTSKMPGYKAWPSFITPDEYIPDEVRKHKKKGSNICVVFIPDGDYYWMSKDKIKVLSQEELDKEVKKIDASLRKKWGNLKFIKERRFAANKRATTVSEAFAATSGLDFDSFMDLFRDSEDEDGDANGNEEKDGEVEEEEQEEDQEDNMEDVVPEQDSEPKAQSRKSKSAKGKAMKIKKPLNGKEIEDEGEYGDVEEGNDDSSVSESSRRVRRGSRQQQSKDVAKSSRNEMTPPPSSKNGRKRNLEENTTPTSQIAKKAKADSSSEDDITSVAAAAAAAASAASSTNTKQKLTEAEKSQQLFTCRYKLQTILIQRHQPNSKDQQQQQQKAGEQPRTPTSKENKPTYIPDSPSADDLSVCRLILYRLSEFTMTKGLLQKSKIHKVLKCIIKDPNLEYPSSFKLHERCKELLSEWNPLIEQIHEEKRIQQAKLGAGDQKLKSSQLLAIKNGDHTNLEESEVSGIEQSLPDIEQNEQNEDEDLTAKNAKSEKEENKKPKADGVIEEESENQDKKTDVDGEEKPEKNADAELDGEAKDEGEQESMRQPSQAENGTDAHEKGEAEQETDVSVNEAHVDGTQDKKNGTQDKSHQVNASNASNATELDQDKREEKDGDENASQHKTAEAEKNNPSPMAASAPRETRAKYDAVST
ncbi:uncharacterized protein LODBEIA_P42180 [Lodderomyces beijingensis]|uniref:PWWP domain-containing protein n=1 Tax=Lodderomyces beijingensis TaxID=1775926 RepID=A0ABP0ZQ04_9ASCO